MKSLILLIVVFALCACTGGGSSSTADGSGGKNDGASATPTPPPGTIYEGNWTTGCTIPTGRSYSYIVTYKIADLKAVRTKRMYGSMNCTEPLYSEAVRSEDFEIDGAGEDPGKVNLLANSQLFTLYGPGVVANANIEAFCGFTDWKNAVPKEVLGRTCDGTAMPVAGKKIYSIFLLGNGGTPFQIGIGTVDYDGSTPEKRHRSLDTDIFVRAL